MSLYGSTWSGTGVASFFTKGEKDKMNLKWTVPVGTIVGGGLVIMFTVSPILPLRVGVVAAVMVALMIGATAWAVTYREQIAIPGVVRITSPNGNGETVTCELRCYGAATSAPPEARRLEFRQRILALEETIKKTLDIGYCPLGAVPPQVAPSIQKIDALTRMLTQMINAHGHSAQAPTLTAPETTQVQGGRGAENAGICELCKNVRADGGTDPSRPRIQYENVTVDAQAPPVTLYVCCGTSAEELSKCEKSCLAFGGNEVEVEVEVDVEVDDTVETSAIG
jgi:hypothetical protein